VSYRLVLAAGTFSDAGVEQEVAAGRASVTLRSIVTPEETARWTVDADAVIVTNNPLTQGHIEALADSVRIIGRAGVGLDAIDLTAASARGIAVYHLPDYATNEVATHATALILALHRRVLAGDAIARSSWLDWRAMGEITPIEEQVVGVVGCGRIGQAVIRRLAPLAGKIVAYDPYISNVPPPAVLVDTLDELLIGSDIITLHLPSIVGQAPVIGAHELSLLRRSALIVNVSRGGLVDETALAEALQAGKVGGAALDVLAEEPPRAEAEILAAPSTLLSPHVGWYSASAEPRARRQVVNGVLAWLDGERPTVGRLALEGKGA